MNGFLPEKDTPLYDRPSKSQVKREMIALQKLGEQLATASKERLARVLLPEILRKAIEEFGRVKGHEGRRRHLQYIGRLMRDLSEEELQNIRAAIESWSGKSKAETAALHALENWRERLINDENALSEFVSAYPKCDTQHLRNLIRNARKETEQNKSPKAFREIFQFLKNTLQQTENELNTKLDGSENDA